jgi:hypothetical protein
MNESLLLEELLLPFLLVSSSQVPLVSSFQQLKEASFLHISISLPLIEQSKLLSTFVLPQS